LGCAGTNQPQPAPTITVMTHDPTSLLVICGSTTFLLARLRQRSRCPVSKKSPEVLAIAQNYWCPKWMVNSEWIPNVSYLLRRSAMLQDSTLENLLVVTDFDATLTCGVSKQCHDLMGHSTLLSQNFRDEFAPLLDWQSNTAIDGVEWWDTAHSLMIKYGQPPRHLIPRLVREAHMNPRPGALELLTRLAKLGVPVLIVSAGLSDIIEEFLRQHNAYTENITVCSNRLNYAADSAPQSLSPDPPITSFTKTTAYSASSSFFQEHSNRSTILVLGDSCSDIDSAANIPYKHLISVGFLNDKPIKEAAKYAQTFDAIVLGANGSLKGVHKLVDDIIAGPEGLAPS
jgi:5'-nucleotidase